MMGLLLKLTIPISSYYHITTEIKDNGTIIFVAKTTDNEKQSIFNISINSDGNTNTSSSLETITEITEDSLEGVSSFWASNPAENNSIMGKMVLASICYSKADGNMRALTTDFFRDIDSSINEIKDYDVMYLLKSEFIK